MQFVLAAIPGSKGDKDIMHGALRWGSVVRSSHGVYRIKDASGNTLHYRVRATGGHCTIVEAIDDAVMRGLLQHPAKLQAEARARRLQVREAFARADLEERELLDARASRVVRTLAHTAPLTATDVSSLKRAVVDAMRWAQTI
ncbi:hypothetical protein JQ608_06930 [Bradyrhizobium liaoningense]|uniref:hypothetical protein n=1 Tax=Bradyrhizobium liaoningense TaxID=43992 RepID=UPI001BAE18DE|nr:hypothetical protein [Bradyrhizobium liaoningense]MBR0876936.1 hypothetical protein [Bradyrhizobium liaoningense]